MRCDVTYYRVALQSDQSPHWMWTSTVLVSLDAMFGFLKLHHLVKRDRLRVFFSSSFEHLLNGSGRIDQLEMQRFESACDLHPYLGTALTSLLTAQLWHEQRQHAPSEERTNAREMRPVAVELSGSADHDVPYHFALPLSLPQVLAWARLRGRVQRGELEP